MVMSGSLMERMTIPSLSVSNRLRRERVRSRFFTSVSTTISVKCLHFTLWSFQSPLWHSRLQYTARPHRPHFCSLVGRVSSPRPQYQQQRYRVSDARERLEMFGVAELLIVGTGKSDRKISVAQLLLRCDDILRINWRDRERWERIETHRNAILKGVRTVSCVGRYCISSFLHLCVWTFGPLPQQ